MSGKVSVQAKVLLVSHLAVLAVGLIAEISLFSLIPEENSTMRVRFWAQYLAELAFLSVVGWLTFIGVDSMAKSGWNKAAWALAVVPFACIASRGFVLHGVDTILGSTSGTGSLALIKSAYAAKKKKSNTK